MRAALAVSSLLLLIGLVSCSFKQDVKADLFDLVHEQQAMDLLESGQYRDDRYKDNDRERSSDRNKDSRDSNRDKNSKHSRHRSHMDHDYAKPLNVQCNARRGEAIYSVESEQTGGNYDRIWKWGCHRVVNFPLTDCDWTQEINKMQGPISYMCPMNKVMTGISSEHKPFLEDRTWKVQCCKAQGYHTEGCIMTPFLAKRNAPHFKHRVKSTCRKVGIFAGFVASRWIPHDREWKILECGLVCDNANRRSISP